MAAEYRTLVSPHAGTHENHNGIYIASQALGNDTMVARSVDDTTMVAHPSDVLQFLAAIAWCIANVVAVRSMFDDDSSSSKPKGTDAIDL